MAPQMEKKADTPGENFKKENENSTEGCHCSLGHAFSSRHAREIQVFGAESLEFLDSKYISNILQPYIFATT